MIRGREGARRLGEDPDDAGDGDWARRRSGTRVRKAGQVELEDKAQSWLPALSRGGVMLEDELGRGVEPWKEGLAGVAGNTSWTLDLHPRV